MTQPRQESIRGFIVRLRGRLRGEDATYGLCPRCGCARWYLGMEVRTLVCRNGHVLELCPVCFEDPADCLVCHARERGTDA